MDNIVLNRREAEEFVETLKKVVENNAAIPGNNETATSVFSSSEMPFRLMQKQISTMLDNGACESIIVDIRWSKEFN